MDICAEIVQRRKGSKVRCGILSVASPAVADIARAFDLSPIADCYGEVSAEKARAILVRILHRDLAYDSIIVPLDEAEELAAGFLLAASSPACGYFSNGDFSRTPPLAWNPATEATFDTGILVVGAKQSACLWVEDED
jgi:hypothetical protein